jgi:hypothetical protein
MNSADHEKRIDWLFGRILPHIRNLCECRHYPECHGLIRGLIDDALAEAFEDGRIAQNAETDRQDRAARNPPSLPTKE